MQTKQNVFSFFILPQTDFERQLVFSSLYVILYSDIIYKVNWYGLFKCKIETLFWYRLFHVQYCGFFDVFSSFFVVKWVVRFKLRGTSLGIVLKHWLNLPTYENGESASFIEDQVQANTSQYNDEWMLSVLLINLKVFHLFSVMMYSSEHYFLY